MISAYVRLSSYYITGSVIFLQKYPLKSVISNCHIIRKWCHSQLVITRSSVKLFLLYLHLFNDIKHASAFFPWESDSTLQRKLAHSYTFLQTNAILQLNIWNDSVYTHGLLQRFGDNVFMQRTIFARMCLPVRKSRYFSDHSNGISCSLCPQFCLTRPQNWTETDRWLFCDSRRHKSS